MRWWLYAAALINFRHGEYKETKFVDSMSEVLRRGMAALELEKLAGVINPIGPFRPSLLFSRSQLTPNTQDEPLGKVTFPNRPQPT